MKLRWLIFFSLLMGLISSGSLRAQKKNDSVFNWSQISSFPLIRVTPTEVKEKDILVPLKPFQLFIFLSPECPLSKAYTRTLNKLFDQYGERVAFFGCISGKGFTQKEIRSFISTYKIVFPLMVDESKKFTKYICATVTPEVILLNQKGEMIYKGAIDDWVAGLGKQKLTISKHYLEDAIIAALNNKEVVVKRTRSYGCLINDY